MTKTYARRYLLVDHHGRGLGQRTAAFGQYLDVARIAHQVEGGQISQHVGQPAQRGAGLLPGFGPLVAGGAEGDKVVYLIGP